MGSIDAAQEPHGNPDEGERSENNYGVANLSEQPGHRPSMALSLFFPTFAGLIQQVVVLSSDCYSGDDVSVNEVAEGGSAALFA
ncbi:hypothetical protein AM10699_64000 (plasmid) [Acaryochloris marina MBIC10699]|nr:hypothetical protein AM10699_64000 [Acaryochloris marina MBIC10699]